MSLQSVPKKSPNLHICTLLLQINSKRGVGTGSRVKRLRQRPECRCDTYCPCLNLGQFLSPLMLSSFCSLGCSRAPTCSTCRPARLSYFLVQLLMMLLTRGAKKIYFFAFILHNTRTGNRAGIVFFTCIFLL